jgi:2-polyprenyl-6-methoxyphenol hydroxylase-like FAD-dependent oxidoreductase
MTARPANPVDVLVVGAGPTGLALAAQLAAFGASVRVVDRRTAPARKSRALVVQPGTLEVLRPLGVTQALLDRGDRPARVQVHLDGRDLAVPLLDTDADATGYPFLLVLARRRSRRRCWRTWPPGGCRWSGEPSCCPTVATTPATPPTSTARPVPRS